VWIYSADTTTTIYGTTGAYTYFSGHIVR